ncbi:MAG: DNA internalization-related competence protein ComEC/Rec2 [Rheinheimera sp.]|nr:DNA internalization-related competence protein ComEC/Rec2 [Rheinheimera sp.]
MERFSFGVLAAAMLALWLEHLPPVIPLAILFCAALLCWRHTALYCGALAYLLSLSLQFAWQMQSVQQIVAEHSTEVCGQVVSLPRQYVESSRFILQLSDDCAEKPQIGAGGRLELRWYADAGATLPTIKAGQHWHLPVRIKAVRGLANPGSPWREANALVDGIVAVATVSSATGAQLLIDTHSVRQQLADQFARCCQQYAAYPLWLALTIGERPFSAELWQGVQHAGLAHLLSISGMHIALLFALCLMFKPLLAQFGFREPWRSVWLWGFALAAAWFYAALAGFAVPTLRAVLTLSVVVLLRFIWHRASIWQFSWLVSASLLLLWPFLLLSYSFWLSASALALLALLEWQHPQQAGIRALLWRFVLFQCGFSLLLLPVGLLLFQGIAPFALWVNLLILPLMTLLGIPLLLLLFGLICVGFNIAPWCWQLLDALYWPLLWLLDRASQADGWWSLPALPWQSSLLLLPALLLLWCCRGRWQLAALALWLPILLPTVVTVSLSGTEHKKSEAALWLHVLDVGQGSAAVLQQGDAALVIDLGPAYGPVSATRQVLMPFLRYQGIRQLDYVLISHDDSDHSGDWPSLRAQYPTTQLVSDIRRLAPRFFCTDLPQQWRGVRLQALRAGSYRPEPANEDSCALLLDTGHYRVLLPGDIGAREDAVAANMGPVDVLVLGHHGSKTASSLRFLQALQPKLALVSSGYQNQFGHPAPETRARLSLLQIPLLNTADSGYIRLDLSATTLRYQLYRPRRFARWLENSVTDAETVVANE